MVQIGDFVGGVYILNKGGENDNKFQGSGDFIFFPQVFG